MLDVQCSMFDVHFLVNPSYEIAPEWHGFLKIKLCASAAGGGAETYNLIYFLSLLMIEYSRLNYEPFASTTDVFLPERPEPV